MARNGAGKARSRAVLPAEFISRTTSPGMADVNGTTDDHQGGSVYRVAGALTITRAATTQREIAALPDPLTIDLSEIDRMDTVGAWLIYRAVRDRGAKVVGASRDECRSALDAAEKALRYS